MDELEAVELTGLRGTGQVEAHVPAARPRNLVQRRPALRRAVRVGAALEQLGGDFVVSIGRGEHERARPVEQGVVRVGARFEQRTRRVDRAGPHGEQQCAEIAGRRTHVDIERVKGRTK